VVLGKAVFLAPRGPQNVNLSLLSDTIKLQSNERRRRTTPNAETAGTSQHYCIVPNKFIYKSK
jgi:hypothetical protein